LKGQIVYISCNERQADEWVSVKRPMIYLKSVSDIKTVTVEEA